MSTIVLGTIDAGGDGKAVLLANINSVLGTSYTLDEFDFGTPELVTISSPTRNSVVRLAPKAVSGYYGTRKVYYNRIHASELGVISVARGSATMVSGLLTAINEKYGILVTSADIYDAVLPAAVPGVDDVTVALDFRPSSFVYYGGTQVVLGANDPNLGGGAAAPFSGVQTLFGWASEEVTNGRTKFDAFSIVIDQDKSRKRTAIVEDGAESIGNVLKRVWGEDEAEALVGSKQVLVAGSFMTSGGKLRSVDVYGNVLELDGTWSGWGTSVGQVMPNEDWNSPMVVVVAAQNLRPIRAVMQESTGDVVVLKLWDGAVEFMRSTNGGSNWSSVVNLVPGSTKLLDIDEWGNDLELKDCVIHNGVVYALLKTTGTEWVVESFNLGTGECLSMPIQDTVLLSGQTISLATNKIAFMTPLATMPAPTLVFATTLMGTHQPMVFMASRNGGAYEVSAVKQSLLDFDFMTDASSYVSGYQMDIVRNPAWRLDVIEVATHVDTDTASTEYASIYDKRSLTGYKTFGIKALTSVNTGAGRSQWVESNIALGGVNSLSLVKLQSPGKAMHYHIQAENSLVRLSYTETIGGSTPNGFVAQADTSIVIEKSGQYRRILGYGSAAYVRPTITENAAVTYTTVPTTNIDAAKPDLEYSYIATGLNGSRTWLTAAATATTLLSRTFGSGYMNLGTAPVAVANMGTGLYMVTDSNVVMYSANKGKTWQSWCDARSFYKQIDGISNRDIGSSANVPWTPSMFKMGNFIFNKAVFEVESTLNANVMDKLDSLFNTPLTLTTRALVSFNEDYAGDDDAYETMDYGLSFGLNYIGWNQPTDVKYWSADAQNNVLVTGKYTSDGRALLNETVTNVTTLQTFPVDTTILDVKKDVLYLDSKEIVLVKTAANVYKLEGVRSNDDPFTFELFGGSRPSTAAFTPELSFYLWDYQETNYVPLVYYGNKDVLLIERLIEDGTFMANVYHLSIPQDNGAPFKAFPMFNKNRREYAFYQKGNGIFTLGYTYNNVSRTVTFSLTRIFALSDPSLNALDIVTGCKLETTVAVAPTVPLIPSYPAAGTLLSWACSGTTKVGNYADGSGGTYQQTIELNSLDCGYVAPTPGPVEAATATITINSATNQDVNTEVVIGEDGTAYIVYDLSNPLTAATNIVFDALFDEEADASDIAAYAWRIGTAAWNTITLPATVTLPQGAQNFALRVQYVEDLETEGEEHYSIIFDKAPGNTQITSAAITTRMTINDTSIGGQKSISYYDPFPDTHVEEREEVLFKYNLSEPNVDPVNYKMTLTGDLDAEDIDRIVITFDDWTSFSVVTSGSTFTIPPGTSSFAIAVQTLDDYVTESPEAVTITLVREPGFPEFNTIPVVKTIMVNDSEGKTVTLYQDTASVWTDAGGGSSITGRTARVSQLAQGRIRTRQHREGRRVFGLRVTEVNAPQVLLGGLSTYDNYNHYTVDGNHWFINTSDGKFYHHPSGTEIVLSETLGGAAVVGDTYYFDIEFGTAKCAVKKNDGPWSDQVVLPTLNTWTELFIAAQSGNASASYAGVQLLTTYTELAGHIPNGCTAWDIRAPFTVSEGGSLTMEFHFSDRNIKPLSYALSFDGDAVFADMATVKYGLIDDINTSYAVSMNVLPGNNTIDVPAQYYGIRLELNPAEDAVTEGDEQFDVVLTRVENGFNEFESVPVRTTVTINITTP